MSPVAFAIPGDINLPTGGYIYDRRVLALLPSFGVAARHLQLPSSFPSPGTADLAETERILAAVAAGTVLIIDGLSYGAMPVAVIDRARAPIIALVHHPLFLEAGIAPARQAQLHALEKAALSLAKRVVVTSQSTARTVSSEFGIAEHLIRVAEPGTDPAPRTPPSGRATRLLAVGSVVPRKAYDLLVRALAPLHDLDWRLTIAGATDRSAEALAALHEAIRATGLGERISVIGAVSQDRLANLYASTDVFVQPSLFEGYGMVLGEAMARGLPIVCTTGGAAAATVPDNAALKVSPGDVSVLSEAVGRMLTDTDLRRRLADGSWAAGQKLPRWEDTARRIADVVKEIAA